MNLTDTLRAGIDWITRVVTQPLGELDKAQQRARYFYDLARFGARHLQEDNAPQMAAALAYRTLFSLLPVLVLGMVTAKAFLGDQLPEIVRWIVEALGVDGVAVSMEGSTEQSIPLGQWLQDLAMQAGQLNLSALGWVGAAVVAYSAISLMVTIENSFNTVYRAPSGRSWLKRVPMYWFVLTVGPLLFGFTPWIDSRFELLIELLPAWGWVATLGHILWSVVALWIFMFALYMIVPNANVGLKPALLGALVAAILIEVGKRFLGAYLSNAFAVSRLYGSLGLVPLFMLWVYVMWMVVLFGLEVAALVQTLGGRGVEEMRQAEREFARHRGALVDPASVLLVMEAIGSAFRRGQSSTTESISEHTGLHPLAVGQMNTRLVQRGYLHRVETPNEGVVLARPPEEIPADDLMQVGFELSNTGDRSGLGVLDGLRRAQTEFARGRTLASLFPSLDGTESADESTMPG